LRLALAADTLSIIVMEIVDNAVMVAVPGAMDTGLIWRIKGMLGEMLTMSTPAYQARRKAALADAEALARRLNEIAARSGKPGGWEVSVHRSQVRAPAAADSARLASFYDDTITVRRVVPGQQHGEAYVILATQIKSGSAAGVVGQIARDVRRGLGGLIELNSRTYHLLPNPPDFPTTRVFVGPELPPASVAIRANVPIETVVLPMSSAELESVAKAFLQANNLLL
ncbi:hypothetical protein ACWCSH_11715, partial [Streptosporangium sp. NPDC001682]